MALTIVTATAITTAPLLITATASLFGEPTTVTTNVFTTAFGLPGQTVTIFPPTVTAEEPKYTPYRTGSRLPPFYTVTVNEVDAFVQAPSGTVWTRVFYDETGNAAEPILAYWGEPYVPEEKVQKSKGLISVGLVLFVFAMLLLWWCCLDRRDEWMVQPGARYWVRG